MNKQTTKIKNFFEIYEPIVDWQNFNIEDRKAGISGFMRIRNEAEFLDLSVRSWLDLVDELIIVYNNCQDATPEILQKLALEFPDKLKVFHYVPIVHPPGSKQFYAIDADHPQSLVNYYNFTLAQTTRQWVIKIDGDLILDKQGLANIKNFYQNNLLNNPKNFLAVSGINVVDHLGKIYALANNKFCGLNGDLCLLKVSEGTKFIKKEGLNTELLNLSGYNFAKRIFGYYHLKFMKDDFGIGNYELEENEDSIYFYQYLVLFLTLDFTPIKPLAKLLNLNELTMKDLNLKRKHHYKKEALNYFLKNHQNEKLRKTFNGQMAGINFTNDIISEIFCNVEISKNQKLQNSKLLKPFLKLIRHFNKYLRWGGEEAFLLMFQNQSWTKFHHLY